MLGSNTADGLNEPLAGAGRTARHLALRESSSLRRNLLVRDRVLASVRETLHTAGFVAIQTPLLWPGPARAQLPFEVTARTDDPDQATYLRTSVEYFLKRMVVSGIPRVYELATTFREEIIDATHLSEYTLLEAYRLAADPSDMQKVANAVVRNAVNAAATIEPELAEACAGLVSEHWQHHSFYEVISRYLDSSVDYRTTEQAWRGHAERIGLSVSPELTADQIAASIYDFGAQESVIGPAFVSGFPASGSPFCKVDPARPELAHKWDLVIHGVEMGTSYAEITDPVEQRDRLSGEADQAIGVSEWLRDMGANEDRLAGMSMGLDRLVSLIVGADSVEDVIAFPAVFEG